MNLTGLADVRVLPRVDDTNRPFFAGAARGELLLPCCGACGHVFFYPRSACPRCLAPGPAWIRGSGRGTVRVSAVVHRPPWDDLPRRTPYVVALVQLEEGPTMLSTVEGVDPGSVVPGLAVTAAFERVREDLGLVRFTAEVPPAVGEAISWGEADI